MFKRILMFIALTTMCAFLFTGVSVKRGPASHTHIQDMTWYIDNEAIPSSYMSTGGDNANVNDADDFGKVGLPVYLTGQGYTRIAVHRLYCTWIDGDEIIAGDRADMCVAYITTNYGTVTNTTSCVRVTHVDAVANSIQYDEYDTTTYIPATEATLLVAITNTVDVGSLWSVVCTAEVSGAN